VVPVPAKKKCPDIEKLPTYDRPPGQSFWKTFPSRSLPKNPVSNVDYKRLKSLVNTVSSQLTDSQILRANRTIHELENGCAAPLKYELPGIRVPNTKSASEFGEEFTDTVAWWIRSGYVAGPFPTAPTENFRANSMIALEQKDKIRIVMNLSAPKGESFNEAIDELKLEQVFMSTARKFGYSVIDCGRGARMWKWDLVDAYKNIPVPISSLRYQGFRWLGKSFVETQKIFGDKDSVAAFDRLNHTAVDLACVMSGIPDNLVHRTLDDTPLVTPEHWTAGHSFASAYEYVCTEINAKLAPPCPKQEKTFSNVTHGSVLGIVFDTENLTWSITPVKLARILRRLQAPLNGNSLSLLDAQKLLGTLNDIGQMAPFLNGFRQPLQEFLTSFNDNDNLQLALNQQERADLRVWAVAATSAATGLPIPHRPSNPSLKALTFVSDAAGAQFIRNGDLFTPFCTDEYRGAVSINSLDDGGVWFAARVIWPKHFLLNARDSKNHAFGCKSATLEAIGLLLPFLCCPKIVAAKEVTLLTDNEALVFGWEKRRVQHDVSASILMRALHLITHFLGCIVTINHLPRMSTPSAELADLLTRSSTAGEIQLAAIADAYSPPVPAQLLDWLVHPTEDWNLAYSLLQAVKHRMV
jgi:hypothetical protein